MGVAPARGRRADIDAARPGPPGCGRARGARRRRALLLYPLLSDDLYYQNMIILSLVFAIGAVGLNIITGYGGYMSLGQGAFMGLGGYTIGDARDAARRVTPWLWVPVAGVVAARRARRCSGSSRCARAGRRS